MFVALLSDPRNAFAYPVTKGQRQLLNAFWQSFEEIAAATIQVSV